ncbi:hypothetical protein HCA69_13835 [Listeria grandensis]|uniref:Uncharacterized protein n=1 Tax=Listeria grandensis TaxID=1494963 RepID=A0A7X0Y6S6_9LIST|nr:hypothetical protein [Listeria grandensis]MBC1937457.1 hypothetical protein [Listeria grandensis]
MLDLNELNPINNATVYEAYMKATIESDVEVLARVIREQLIPVDDI